MFEKILIANRGEIAVRIIRACREMGIQTVAVYSEADREALHTMLADEAICIGPAPSSESYLDMERILSAAVATGAQAIHPGFGFLSENAHFAALCGKCNIAFIGPDAEIIEKMGNKAEARKTMMEAGIPVVPGSKAPFHDAKEALEAAKEIGFPIMIKASAGGGGKGMRLSESEEDFLQNFKNAQLEAEKGFSDSAMYLERYVRKPQAYRIPRFWRTAMAMWCIWGSGTAPSSGATRSFWRNPPAARFPGSSAGGWEKRRCAQRKRWAIVNAGTIEFLLDEDRNFYFMEMNTRIQVEHPVTEAVTDLDLIREQIRIAAGERLSFSQEDVAIRGHAIECRINAENPEKHFMPCPGKITNVHLPGGRCVRVDTAIYSGYTVPGPL